MHNEKATPRLGALTLPSTPVDRFDLGIVVTIRDEKAGRLLAPVATDERR